MKKTFRLAELVTADGRFAFNQPYSTIEGSQFKDWLIVTVPTYTSPEQLRSLRDNLVQAFGSKVFIVTEDVRFCVFEEVK